MHNFWTEFSAHLPSKGLILLLKYLAHRQDIILQCIGDYSPASYKIAHPTLRDISFHVRFEKQMTENLLSASFLDHLLDSEDFSNRIDTAEALLLEAVSESICQDKRAVNRITLHGSLSTAATLQKYRV